MIQAETLITLSIQPAPDGNGLLVSPAVEGEPVAPPWIVPAPRWREIHLLVDQYRHHLRDSSSPPELMRHALESVGLELFQAFLEPAWDRIQESLLPGRPRMLAISSPVADFLLLPWEILLPPSGSPLGLEPGFFIRRLPMGEEGPRRCCLYLPPAPLRVLFFAASPTDQEPLDREAEVTAFVGAVSMCVETPPVWDVVEEGTLAALRQRILHFQPHVVHLCGQVVLTGEQGYFCFEQQDGHSDPRSGKEMDRQIFARAPVQLLLISGRPDDKPPPSAALGLLCREVARHGVPMALSFPASLTSPQGGRWAETLYGALSHWGEIDTALHEGRRALLAMGEASGYPGWTLPLLFGATTQRLIMNRSAPPVRPPPPAAAMGVPPGRWELVRRIVHELRGSNGRGIMLTGPDGVGKSHLVAYVQGILAESGWTPLRLEGTPHRPPTVARLLEITRQGLRTLGHVAEAEELKNPELSVPDRLSLLLGWIREIPLLYILDDVDALPHRGEPDDEEWSLVLPLLLDRLGGASRILLTARCVPACISPPPDPLAVVELPLLNRGVVQRMLLKRERIHALIRLGVFTPDALTQCLPEQGMLAAHGLPWAARLEQGALPPSGWIPSTQEFLAHLSDRERDGLIRVAAWAFPVPEEALLALLSQHVDDGEAPTLLDRWRGQGALEADPLTEGRWRVASWLRADLKNAAPMETHLQAGSYLLTCFDENREASLGLDWVELLLEARGHFLRGDDFETALNLTERICEGMLGLGLHTEVRRLHRELLSWRRHPASLNRIGWSYVHSGAWTRALPWFQEAWDRSVEETTLTSMAQEALVGLIHAHEAMGEQDQAEALRLRLGSMGAG